MGTETNIFETGKTKLLNGQDIIFILTMNMMIKRIIFSIKCVTIKLWMCNWYLERKWSSTSCSTTAELVQLDDWLIDFFHVTNAKYGKCWFRLYVEMVFILYVVTRELNVVILMWCYRVVPSLLIWSQGSMVKTATSQNGDSQNGDIVN